MIVWGILSFRGPFDPPFPSPPRGAVQLRTYTLLLSASRWRGGAGVTKPHPSLHLDSSGGAVDRSAQSGREQVTSVAQRARLRAHQDCTRTHAPEAEIGELNERHTSSS